MLAAGCFAFYLLANERVAAQIGSVAYLVIAVTAAALSVHFLIFSDFRALELPAESWALLVVMTAATNVLPLFMVSAGIRRLGAQRAAIITTIGPPFTMFLAYLLLGEVMKPAQLAGVAAIVAGILILEVRGGTRD